MSLARDEMALFRGGTTLGLTDCELLSRFLDRRDGSGEIAFEAIVARHGPMVLAACRRQLRDPEDAADAFQATFLTLARKARSIRDAQSLAGWLHRVARQASGRARLRASKRREVERSLTPIEAGGLSHSSAKVEADELREILDEELTRLPRSFRAPLILCYLEGLTHEEAADQLDCPVGTVRSRLARGRDRLRSRLIRRGIAPASCVLGATLPFEAQASVPTSLANLTVKAASLVATGRSVAAGSAAACSLMEGVVRTMFLTKLRGLIVVLAIAGMIGIGVGRFAISDNPKAILPQDPVAQVPPKVVEKPELRGDWDDLKGYWDLVSIQDSGKTLHPKDAHFDECMVFPPLAQPGNQLTTPGTIVTWSEDPRITGLERWTVSRIDPAASPKTIFLQSHAPGLTTPETNPEKKQVFHHSGIYRVTADELTVCVNRGTIDPPRPPSKLASEAATGTMLLTFRRRPKGDLRDLRRLSIQGSWEVVSVEPPGPQPLSPKPGQTWVIGPDSMRWNDGDRVVTQFSYRLGPGERLVMKSPEVGKIFAARWSQDRGMTLRFSYGKEPPVGQSGTEAPGAAVVVLKRLTDPPASALKVNYQMPEELTAILNRYKWTTGVLPPPLRSLPVPIRR